MRKRMWICFAVIPCLFFLWQETSRFSAQDDKEAPVECCYVHDGYQGVCRVTPAEEETCEKILEYLNTPSTVGKNYCGGSKLRGGWKLIECEQDKGGE